MKIEIKNRFTGSVIFELDIENNSIALTLKAAIESNVNLSGAILRWADLSEANLSGANLSDANLSGATLRGATLRCANLSGATLRWATLRWANLSDANLSGADLSDANLSDATLRDANLSGATLSCANLSDANLSGADLSGADLSGATLRCAIGNKRELRTLQLDSYSISFTDSVLQIGCKRFTPQEWRDFGDNEISNMDNGALDWWKKWKDFVFKVIELSFCEQVQA